MYSSVWSLQRSFKNLTFLTLNVDLYTLIFYWTEPRIVIRVKEGCRQKSSPWTFPTNIFREHAEFSLGKEHFHILLLISSWNFNQEFWQFD